MRYYILLFMILVIAAPTYANPKVIDLTYSTSSQSMANDIGLAKPTQNNSLDAHLHQTAYQYGINPLLIKAIIKVESNYQANARSPKGALGLMQVLPSTAAQYGNYNLLNPKENITVGTRHFAYLMNKYQGQVHLALAAYNAGEGNVAKYGGIPPFTETRQYIIKVSKYYQSLRSDGGVSAIIAQEQNHQQAVAAQDDTTNESNHPPQKTPTVLIINLN
ncbi:lytic transglycosylase domain-containing protein (plasmid) [Moraxella bovis]|uniref:Lytic transglycosylase domain-containing protein n=1 Tax=Moraxella bovis TaxID=476 RepID=A0ABY6ME93_MORBO|nr:lytic transglycosylase domain-containing protein [Moraxella bovis]UZA04741.1 lytic transglycosylase domain-containing protein [Moraxella bovis]